MIRTAMALAAVAPMRSGREEQAREARLSRLVALVLDTIVVGILSGVAVGAFGVTVVTSGSPVPINGSAFYRTETTIPALWTTLIWLGYYTICEGMFSATPGKVITGLRVVSVDRMGLTFRSIVIRNLLRIVDVLPGAYLLGGALVMRSRFSQRVGDRWARTTVVARWHAVEPGSTRSSSVRARVLLVALVLVGFLFTAGFDYFGRPPLEIQGLYNQRRLLSPDLVSYSLGQPAWSLGSVTYPIKFRTSTDSCSGSIQLNWYGVGGWQLSGARWTCPPS